jgi:hypothetical protein
MRLVDLLPAGELPRTGNPEARVDHWYGQDNAENYRRRGGHPLYGETDITYSYNRRGYRSPEFEDAAAVRMVSVGCSWVFGVGLPAPVLFHERFADRLRTELGTSVINWNLGVPGASNDAIVRLLHLAVAALRPDVVLILFTYLGRREYVTAHDRHVAYTPAWTAPDPVAQEVGAHFAALASKNDDRLNLFRNYKSAEALLTRCGWAFSFVLPDDAQPIRDHFDTRRLARPHRSLDKARDHAHSGPLTHESLYDGYWTAFAGSGGLETLRQRALGGGLDGSDRR